MIVFFKGFVYVKYFCVDEKYINIIFGCNIVFLILNERKMFKFFVDCL